MGLTEISHLTIDRESDFATFSSTGLDHHASSNNRAMREGSNLYRITRAGFPATTAYGGTSLETTEPEPITAPCPILRPERTMTHVPIQTSEPIDVWPLRPCAVVPLIGINQLGLHA